MEGKKGPGPQLSAGIDEQILNDNGLAPKDELEEISEAVVTDYIDNDVSNNAPLDKLIDYKKRGLSYEAISAITGVNTATIKYRLKPHLTKIQALDTYKKHRPDLLRMLQREILLSITPEEISSMSVKDRMVSFGILYDKEKHEEGKPTNSVNIHFNFMKDYFSPAEEHPEVINVTPSTDEN